MDTTTTFDREAMEKDMLKGFGSAFNDAAAFPDITITVNGSSFLCHKVVLAQRSDWFQRAFTGRFKEASLSTIDLQEDDLPDMQNAIGAMLKYCYTLDFEISGTGLASFSVVLFALAEKYFVKGLDLLAAEKFGTTLETTSPEDLEQAVRYAYEGCSDIKQVLRGRIVQHFIKKGCVLSGADTVFNDLLDKAPGFAADVVRAMVKQDPSSEPDANHIATFPHGLQLRCPRDLCSARTGHGGFIDLPGPLRLEPSHNYGLICEICLHITHMTGAEWLGRKI